MTLSINRKIDTLAQSARIMDIEIREIFLNEKDYNEIVEEAKKNNVSGSTETGETLNQVAYDSTVGLIKISKK